VECKIVIGDPASGKSYSMEAKAEQARVFLSKKIGDTVSGNNIGLKGYELEITGGSDKSGFPMVPSVEGRGRTKTLFREKGAGYKLKSKGVRKRKTVRKNTISEDVAQINVKVVKKGGDKIEKLIGVEEQAKEEGEKKEEKPVEEKKEEKKEEPVEEKKEEPKEEKKEEPVEEKKDAEAEEKAKEEPAAEKK